MLIHLLIVFFIIVLCIQILFSYNIIEGLENNAASSQYTNYDTNNPANAFILAQQNAGNIAYIKDRLDEFQGVQQELQDISGNVIILQSQVNSLVQAQQEYATQMTGGTPPTITGAVDDNDE